MNTYVAWKPFYSVGHPALDAQHKQIIGVINDLYAAMSQGEERAALESLLDRLVQYTKTHFAYEEQVMQQHDYPGLTHHKRLHDRLRQRTADLRAHLGLVTGVDLLHFLKEWWLEHIQGQDKQYAPYLEVAAYS